MCHLAPALLGMNRSPTRSGLTGERVLGDGGIDRAKRLEYGEEVGYKR